MDGESGEPSVIASGSQHVAAIGIVFDGADGGMAEDEIGEESAASASEEVKRSHVTPVLQAAARR